MNNNTICKVTGCNNPATHTWSGHPTCDDCATPSRKEKLKYDRGFRDGLIEKTKDNGIIFRDGMRHGYASALSMLNIKVLGPAVEKTKEKDFGGGDMLEFLLIKMREYARDLNKLAKQVEIKE